jgi:DNA polymerase III delta subunit
MIILIHGNDEIKSRAKYNALAQSLLAKNPEASLFKLNVENFKIENLEELTKGQGLFYQKFIVSCDNLLGGLTETKKDSEERREQLRNWLKPISQSENIFIFLENNIEEKDSLILKKLATKEQEFLRKEGLTQRLYGGVPGFNIFSITDAFTARNKNRAWALYQEAMMMGISAEEILWKLIWATNNLLLVKNTRDMEKLKMKPYPLTKAKTAAKTFSNEELKNLSASFLDLYHKTYLGTDEFEFGLEKIILSV